MATDDEKKAAALRRKRNAAFSARLERAKKRTFRPYGIALSYLVFNWNRLHEALSLLFIMVVNAPNSKTHLGTADRAVPLAIWHSMRSDSSQRDMLRAATTVAPHLTDRQRADIKWMLQEIDKSLRGDRNSAIHAPLTFSAREIADGSEFAMNANIFSGSRHAKKLGGKNLIEEFDRCAALADCLEGYASAMYGALMHSYNPSKGIFGEVFFAWPKKPKLPHAHQTNNRKALSRRNGGKVLLRRPRSSPA